VHFLHIYGELASSRRSRNAYMFYSCPGLLAGNTIFLTTAYKTYQKLIQKQKPRRSIHTGSAALSSRAVLMSYDEEDARNEDCGTSTTRRYLYLYRHFLQYASCWKRPGKTTEVIVSCSTDKRNGGAWRTLRQKWGTVQDPN